MIAVNVIVAAVILYFLFKDKLTRAILRSGCLVTVILTLGVIAQIVVLIVHQTQPVEALGIDDHTDINQIAQLLYSVTPTLTQGKHGLPGFEGYDYSLGCGSTLYSPVPGNAVVTVNGYDGYRHRTQSGFVYPENTWIHIEGDAGKAILLHGEYDVPVGTEVIGGVTKIGKEASIGWSTGCHSHVVWYPNPEYQPVKPKYDLFVNDYSFMAGDSDFVDNGYISAYRKHLSDETLGNRIKWGQVPPDTKINQGLVLVAVLDCNQIGMTGTLETVAGTFPVLVYDCAGIEDGGADWMINGNYVVEVDGYTWDNYPEIIGTMGTLRLKGGWNHE